MKPSTDVLKTPTFIKITAIALLCLSIFFLTNHFYSNPYPSFSLLSSSPSFDSPFNSIPSPPTNATVLLSPPPLPLAKRIGILDENGVMSENFEAGDFDPSLIEDVTNSSAVQVKVDDGGDKIRVERFIVCEESLMNFIPCLDNVEEIDRLNSTERREKYERHCPSGEKALNCLIPRPKGYQIRIPWPQSRDEVWLSNVPRTRLVEDKGGQNWIAREKDKFTFPGGGRADKYLNKILEMVPDIAFGQKTQVALDIGSGVASFGALLMQRNVTTLLVEPIDNPENSVQLTLERGMPAMVAALATRRLLYPSQAFDLIHCSRFRVNWTQDDGSLLLEVNRLLRAGGYFVWAAQPVYKHQEKLFEQWKEMEDLTTRMCWKLVKKEGYIAIWQKPLNNSCYLNRDTGLKPLLCDGNDEPDDVWNVGLKACITQLPENGYGSNFTTLPLERLLEPPDRLQSIKIDAFISRKEIFKAETKYWIEIIDGYIRAYHWKELNFRNVMDMRAGFGGFAAALRKFHYDCWVMNVVPVSGFNTLPVIYDRGLVGVMHDWCEPFDTYPRTYDLLHAASLFSIERKRCNISTIMFEMDRILRPGGRVYIRDSVSLMGELQQIASALGWVPALHDTSEGPHSSWKVLMCDKRL